ncbi:ATP-binding protein [Streptomyces brasiliensis]|uniref:histidine kinase n=1 Tax=Streptomyces brasiliensis TaxID=1954 RepID=A0A917NR67_9ACTN|nr:ATP-binding protein [Streptomyces brasiliensis]GGJ22050.1 histidine kinase [Streptomyces brasiliensis]
MSTNQVDAPARPAPPTRGGIRGFADRWPFRRKLNLLVGIPLAVVAVLLTYLITDLLGQANSARSAAQLVRDSAQVARLVDRVEAEHQQAILLSARYEAGAEMPSADAYRKAQEEVNSQVRKVRGTFGDRLPDTAARALREVEGLSSLRDSVEQAYLPADNIDPAYANTANELIDSLGLDRNAALASTFTGNLLDSLLRADAAHAAFETSVFSATTGDTNALIEFTNAVGAYDLYNHQADRFGRFATDAQAEELAGVEHTPAQRAIAESYAEMQIDTGRLEAGSQAEIRLAVKQALASYPYYPEQAAARLKITTSLIGQIADRADNTSESATWRASLLLSGTLLGFALWIAFAVLVRRSVIRPVQALTGVAHEVADVAGRELARVADDDAEDDGPPRLRDMPVTARDEIGDLAEAFNQVQTTAAALLERQVLSRRNTAEMFGNVGRRVSNLTTRQLALIDAVERGETDPALLERLYSIDHIAVRLRRNADSLMLLAGIRETVLEAGPTELTNVVRAALGQIEGYQRVRLYAATETMVAPDIIGDLTLMVAELVENAVSFSPEGSPVEVTVRAGAEGAHVVVTDHGLGMSAERLAEENARLIRRERLDLMPTKVLGLFVVGTLARRWEIGVELTRTPGGGVTAEVSLPASLLLTMSPVNAAAPTAAAIEPASTTTGGPKPSLTASADEATAGEPGPLPRRTTRRDRAEAGTRTTAPVGESTATAHGTSPAAPAGKPTEPDGTNPPASDATSTPATGTPAPAPGPVSAAPGDAPTMGGNASATSSGRPPKAPLIPRARTESPLPAVASDADGTSRPLRRRVRGATLRTTAGTQQVVPQTVRPTDADAVRDALDEFEAAVERARRDSDTGSFARPGDGTRPTHRPHDQNHHPEGAEQ